MTQPLYDDMLDRLQRDAFVYFVNEVNPANGLVKDCTRPDFPSSIAAVGWRWQLIPSESSGSCSRVLRLRRGC